MVDAAMVLALLLLMGYGLVGEKAHEWIGMGMFFLFLFHHILNRKWLKGMFRGRYTLLRIIQTMLAVLIFLCMIGSMISGLILSRYVFAFLPKYHGYEGFEKIHMLCAYWGFVLMSLHLGLHLNMMRAVIKKHLRLPKQLTWFVRSAFVLFAVYGVAAFIRRKAGSYLLLKSHFVYFDYAEPVFFFLLDYLAIMTLFALMGQAVVYLIQRVSSGNSNALKG